MVENKRCLTASFKPRIDMSANHPRFNIGISQEVPEKRSLPMSGVI